MATEKIDDLISESALNSFTELKRRVDDSVKSFDALVAKAVELNKSLGVSSLKTFTETNERLKEMNDLEEKIVVNTAKLKQEQDKLVSSQTQQTRALSDTIAVQLQYNKAIADNKKQMADLKKSLQDGKISVEAYEREMVKLSKQEALLKQTAGNVNTIIKQQTKEMLAEAGSANQLRSRLALLTSTFDNLNKSQRNSSIGKQIQKEINSVNNELSKLEQSTGRFQRNVGNYKSAVSGIGAALGPLSAAVIGIGSIGQVFNDVIGEAEAAEESTARFKNTLEAAGRTEAFDRLSTEASLLAESFGYLDNDDIIEVFDKLTTYGKLTEKQMTELTPVIIDFAAKSRISVQEATDKIIGGLEGQGKALKLLGVDISSADTVAGRLGIVMTDLKQRVDGAGEAFGQTLKGEVAKATQELKNMEEELGTNLLPIWTDIKVAALQSLSGIVWGIKELGREVRDWWDYIFNPNELKQRQVLKGIEDQKNAANDYARSYVKSIEGGVDVLEKQLAVQKESIKSDLQRQNANRSVVDQGLLNSLAIINALKTEIQLRKETNKIQTQKKGDEKSVTKSFFDDELKDQADAFKKLSEADSLYLSIRINARQMAADLERQILEGNREKEIFNAKNDAQKIYDINVKFAYEQRKLAENLSYDLIKIRKQAAARIVDADKSINEQFQAEAKDAQEKQFASLTKQNEDRISFISQARDEELRQQEITLTKSLQAAGSNTKKRQKADEDAAKKRAETELDYSIQILEQQIKFTEAYIALAKSRGMDVTKEEANLANARMRLAELVNKKIREGFAETKTDFQNQMEGLSQILEEVQNVYNQVTDIISGFIQARVDKQKNAIQDEIDLNDRKTKDEIENINASALTEEEKADRIAIVNARNDAQKQQLEYKQRQLDLQRARFEKATAIGNIILNTAQAITKTLGTLGWPAGALPAVIAGAMGAAQLAVAIAQPLPRFAEGTTDAPGGAAIVGDGGRSELIVTPDGRLIKTPSVPTVMNVPKHSVVLPDAREALEAGIHPRWGGSQMSKDDSATFMLGEKIDRLTDTVKNKREIHVHKTKTGWQMIMKNGNRFVEYINRNI